MLVHVEGETEETFVNRVLRPHLCAHGYCSVDARLVGNARLRSGRGGIRGWESAKRDIVRHLKQDKTCLSTTMVDYYGMPKSGNGAWPGREQAVTATFHARARTVQTAMKHSVEMDAGPDVVAGRFVPYVVMHEFEGLLFSDCRRFAQAIGHQNCAEAFQDIRDRFVTPEEINDSPLTAPSRRILSVVPRYQKPLFGSIAAEVIGLSRIREQCKHFDAWIAELERLGEGA